MPQRNLGNAQTDVNTSRDWEALRRARFLVYGVFRKPAVDREDTSV